MIYKRSFKCLKIQSNKFIKFPSCRNLYNFEEHRKIANRRAIFQKIVKREYCEIQKFPTFDEPPSFYEYTNEKKISALCPIYLTTSGCVNFAAYATFFKSTCFWFFGENTSLCVVFFLLLIIIASAYWNRGVF